MKVTVTGEKFGKKLKVEYENGKFLFDGKEDLHFSDELQFMIDHPPTGYYVTRDEVGIISEVLQNHFFDKPTLDIRTEHDGEEPEFDPNVIY